MFFSHKIIRIIDLLIITISYHCILKSSRNDKSQADEDLAKTLESAPDSAKYPNVHKWYNTVTGGDDDVDLFAEETEEEKLANQQRAEKLKEEQKKKEPVLRSAVVLDVKPYGSDTGLYLWLSICLIHSNISFPIDLAELEKMIREIQMEGLEWKASETPEMAFGVKKLRIMCYIVDNLVSIDADVIPKIEDMEDHVQSVDIHSFTKL